jgi:tripartite-type tricarboxylate transporter receptor subunit TctC
MTDLISAQIQIMFDTLSSSTEHIGAGRWRAMAVMTTTRSDALPDGPTAAESVPGFDAST